MQPTATIERPATGRTALLIVDMINDMAFDGGESMLPRAIDVADRIRELRDQASAVGVPVVYVNDNFGQWHSERSKLIDHCRRQDASGRVLVERLEPRDGDYFIIKPMHSGFYSTNLPVLLPKLGASRLILTGLAADICVLFTAADAHMRDYALWAPRDCVTASTQERTDWALDIMAKALGACTAPFSKAELQAWLDQAPSPGRTRAV